MSRVMPTFFRGRLLGLLMLAVSVSVHAHTVAPSALFGESEDAFDNADLVKVDFLPLGEYFSKDPTWGVLVEVGAEKNFSVLRLKGFRGNTTVGFRASWVGPEKVDLVYAKENRRFAGRANLSHLETNCPWSYHIEVVATYDDGSATPYSFSVREFYPETIQRDEIGRCLYGPANWRYHDFPYFPAGEKRATELEAETHFHREGYRTALRAERDPIKKDQLALFLAVAENNLPAVRELMKRVDPNVKDPLIEKESRTSLNLAMRWGFFEVARAIATKAYRFSDNDLFFSDADAFYADRFARYRFMVDLHPDSEWVDNLFQYGAGYGTMAGGKELYDFVVERKPSTHALNVGLIVYLYGALPQGKLDVSYVPLMNTLLATATEKTRATFLYKAIQGNSLELTKLALTFRPDLRERFNLVVPWNGPYGPGKPMVFKLSALGLAIYQGQNAITEILIKEGADALEMVEAFGEAAGPCRVINKIPMVVWAAYNIDKAPRGEFGMAFAIHQILAQGADKNAKTDNGFTALDMIIYKLRLVTAEYKRVPLSQTARYILAVYRWMVSQHAEVARQEPVPDWLTPKVASAPYTTSAFEGSFVMYEIPAFPAQPVLVSP